MYSDTPNVGDANHMSNQLGAPSTEGVPKTPNYVSRCFVPHISGVRGSADEKRVNSADMWDKTAGHIVGSFWYDIRRRRPELLPHMICIANVRGTRIHGSGKNP